MVHQRILPFALEGLFDSETEDVVFALLESICELCTESVDTDSWDEVITRMERALANFEKSFPALMVCKTCSQCVESQVTFDHNLIMLSLMTTEHHILTKVWRKQHIAALSSYFTITIRGIIGGKNGNRVINMSGQSEHNLCVCMIAGCRLL